MYRFMEQQESHAKVKWAPIRGVSKSGYYAWLETRKERQARDQTREKKVLEIFEESEGHYGAERICGVIRKDGGHVSLQVVKSIMERHKLQ